MTFELRIPVGAIAGLRTAALSDSEDIDERGNPTISLNQLRLMSFKALRPQSQENSPGLRMGDQKPKINPQLSTHTL